TTGLLLLRGSASPSPTLPLVEASHDAAAEAGVAASVLLDAAAADRGSRDVGAEDAGADPPKPELLVEIQSAFFFFNF
ncbi:hypothetical protein Dimus_016136, partial [Dionaea muscipula]